MLLLTLLILFLQLLLLMLWLALLLVLMLVLLVLVVIAPNRRIVALVHLVIIVASCVDLGVATDVCSCRD